MANGDNWYVFGPAAICRASNRTLPPVVDVYFQGSRPEHNAIAKMLEQSTPIQIRYSTALPQNVIDLDLVTLEPSGSALRILDPTSIMTRKKVDVIQHWITLMQSLRLWYTTMLFSDFEWPKYLLQKLDQDFKYARAVQDRDESFRNALLNLDHDFGLELTQELLD